jgi:23S rRNA pseudouridine955/2504/2580 synthase/23S rRNA pseudouridine1911/1915/1917 synthase
MLEWMVTSQESGSKLLSFLTQRLAGQYSARFLKRAIEHNGCQINGRPERFASTLLGVGDHVSLRLEQSSLPVSQQVEPQRILYEDDVLLVYDKPPGVASDEQGILKLLHSYAPSVCLVHRLDRETTGVLILAKQSFAFEQLVEQFKQLNVHKRYQAIVDGVCGQSKGIIKNYLGKKQPYAGQTLWGAVKASQGLYACTEWQLLKRGKQASLVACFPQTGRTHQIRVHFAERGHPIVGDFQYGKQFVCSYQPPRMLLHAERIQFNHPVTGKSMEIVAPLPDDFKEAQHKLFKDRE